jgi:F-type H+-transporting ATPase subunit delta
MPATVANRYARALAELVARTADFRKMLQELENFEAVLRESVELREVCETPAITMDQKLKVLETILERLSFSHLTRNFLRVMLVHYRMSILAEVVQAFRKISDERLGIVRVRVSSAAELSDAERTSLRERFGALTRQQAELEFHLDSNLLGGIVAQIRSTVYDGSIRGRLERFREQLTTR